MMYYQHQVEKVLNSFFSYKLSCDFFSSPLPQKMSSSCIQSLQSPLKTLNGPTTTKCNTSASHNLVDLYWVRNWSIVTEFKDLELSLASFCEVTLRYSL